MPSSITLDPVASALESIRAHFVAGLPGTDCVRGPQEFPEDYAGDVQILSLIEISREWEELPPVEVETVAASPSSSTVTYKVAQIRLRAQLDIWAPYRFHQDLFGPVVGALFHNRVPWQSGLFLASTHYHDRPLSVSQLGGAITQRDPEDVAEGIWRRTWDLEILTDLVLKLTNQPTLVDVRMLLSTELGPDILTEPDYIVPAP